MKLSLYDILYILLLTQLKYIFQSNISMGVNLTVKRMIVKIDEKKCTGCGKCIAPCAEGAIKIINGKAKVVSEELCDGMGFCIGICPEGALSVEERYTVEFNREKAESQPKQKDTSIHCFICGASEDTSYLLPLRHNMQSMWVCTRCLPKLIHG